MAEETPAVPEDEELENDDVEESEGELLPDREAMSIINPGPQPLDS